jgi:anti-anti-sigma factor
VDQSTAVEVSVRGDTAVVRLVGELTQPDVAAVEAELGQLTFPPQSQLVVDLTDVGFMDSSGIALLLRLKRRSAEESFELTLGGVTGAVRSRLDRTGLLSMLIEGGADAVARGSPLAAVRGRPPA